MNPVDKHECTSKHKFEILEGKMKGNNELVVLTVEQMQKDLRMIYENQLIQSKDIKDFMNKCDVTYITKQEFENTKEKVKQVENLVILQEQFIHLKEDVDIIGKNQARVVWIIITAVILAVLGLVIVKTGTI